MRFAALPARVTSIQPAVKVAERIETIVPIVGVNRKLLDSEVGFLWLHLVR